MLFKFFSFIEHTYLHSVCLGVDPRTYTIRNQYLKGLSTTTSNHINYSNILNALIIPISVCYYSKLHGVVTI